MEANGLALKNENELRRDDVQNEDFSSNEKADSNDAIGKRAEFGSQVAKSGALTDENGSRQGLETQRESEGVLGDTQSMAKEDNSPVLASKSPSLAPTVRGQREECETKDCHVGTCSPEKTGPSQHGNQINSSTIFEPAKLLNDKNTVEETEDANNGAVSLPQEDSTEISSGQGTVLLRQEDEIRSSNGEAFKVSEQEDVESGSGMQESDLSDPQNTNKSMGTNTQSTGTPRQDQTNCSYYVKWIMWKGLKTPIVTQNDNGPCPLLAVINILLLRRAIEFPAMQEMVTTSQLMEYLGDHVLNEVPQNLAEGVQRNFEQNMQDALSIVPKLRTGLDVNVKFTGVGDFEFTPECVIFDLLNIHLYHGWLVDPQSTEYKAAIGGLSYNQLVEKVVASKEKIAGSHLVSEGLLAELFLQETANQLTYHGLCELNAKVNEDELCVFFRNNHFSTLYKQKNVLFILLTDQGFLTEDQIVWQTLSNVDGDGIFVNSDFKSLPMQEQPVVSKPNSNPGTLTQEDQDFMLALSIQQQQQQQQHEPSADSLPHASQVPAEVQQPQKPAAHKEMIEQELFDLQYAMQLQEEEETRSRNEPARPPNRRRRQTPPPQLHQSRNGDHGRDAGNKNCAIL